MTGARLRDATARLWKVAADKEGPSRTPAAATGALLLGEALDEFDGEAGSGLNNDGSPVQLSISCGPGGADLRVLADPGAGTSSLVAQRDRALRAGRRILAARAPQLTPLLLATFEEVVPQADHPIDGVSLDEFTSGIAWYGCSTAGPGAALYVDVRPHGSHAQRRITQWLQHILPQPDTALGVVDAMADAVQWACLGVEGATLQDARLKVYLRLRDTMTSLPDLHLPLLAAEPMGDFLTSVLQAHGVDREGLVISVGFRLRDGALADVKADVCGHCLPYGPADWACIIEDLTARHGLARPGSGALMADGVQCAFVGLGLSTGGGERLNVYLKADPATGPVGLPRLRAALDDAVAALSRLQGSDGSWQDYRLPVGPSDQWVTAYVGYALARAAVLTGHEGARTATERASSWLTTTRTYRAGWGYNAATGPDADSTAFAIRLLDLLEQPVAAADRDFLAAHWQGGGCGTYRDDTGWGAPHPGVTAVAFPALTARQRADRFLGLLDFLAACRRPDRWWRSYWWAGPHYATYRVLQLLSGQGLPTDPPHRPAPLPAGNPFELACLAGIEQLHSTDGRTSVTLLDRLLQLQQLDGRWAGSDNLRVTDDTAFTSDTARGLCYCDQQGTITTATAIEALAMAIACAETREAERSSRHETPVP